MQEPTVVFVHGAFADASGFTAVIRELNSAGHAVIAPPNPLRSLAPDAAAVSAAVNAINGPVLLAGHSSGGAVITQVPQRHLRHRRPHRRGAAARAYRPAPRQARRG
jgi:pimeloyl-ACP methyl ester carboxylesterase